MKIGLLTFHAAQNYGSALQAYALQQTLLSMGHDAEIIDYRPQAQRRLYRPFYCKGLRPLIKAILLPRLAWQQSRKSRRFNHFMATQMRLSDATITNPDLLPQFITSRAYDVIICGSDQIWNPSAAEFSQAYLLPPLPGIRRIAYAPSLGPDPDLSVRAEHEPLFRHFLSGFEAISVRDEASARRLHPIIDRRPAVVLDPTMLLSTNQWLSLTDDSPAEDSPYILLYSPLNNPIAYQRAAEEADRLDLNIVVTTADLTRPWIRNPRFHFRADCGPQEFLTLLRHATLIVTTSFHACIFARFFNRPIITVDSTDDARIKALATPPSVESSIAFLAESLNRINPPTECND